MNKKQLKKYLEDPTALSSSDTRKLSLLVDDYPYFQTARFLYAKGLQINDNETFQQQIQTTTLYAVSRSKLYDLVASPEQTVEVNQQPTNTTETKQTQTKEVAETIIEEKPVEQQTEETVQEIIEDVPAVEEIQEEVTEQIKETIEATEPVVENPIEEQYEETVQEVIEETPIVEEIQEEVTEQIEETIEAEPVVENPIEEQHEEIVQEVIEDTPAVEEIQEEITEQIEETIEATEPVVENPIEEQHEEIVQEVIEDTPVVDEIQEETIEKVVETEPTTESIADQILRKYREMKAKEQDDETTDNCPQTVIIQDETPQEVTENTVVDFTETSQEQVAEVSPTNEAEPAENTIEEQETEEPEQPQEEPTIVVDFTPAYEEENSTNTEDNADDSPLSFGLSDFTEINTENISEQDINETTESENITIDFSDEPISFEIEEPSEQEPQPTEIFTDEKSEDISFEIQDETPDTNEKQEEPKEQEMHNWYETSQHDDTAHTQEIINTFISSNYKTPLKTEIDNDEEGMDKEAQEKYLKAGEAEVEFVTEAMAKVYEKQKLFSKAIKIYEKLSLKYPQKSVYFANRIKEIKH